MEHHSPDMVPLRPDMELPPLQITTEPLQRGARPRRLLRQLRLLQRGQGCPVWQHSTRTTSPAMETVEARCALHPRVHRVRTGHNPTEGAARVRGNWRLL